MRPHPKRARTDPTSPRAWATDDLSGFVMNHEDMRYVFQWAGTQLVNQNVLTAPEFLDQPQPQLRAIVLPPDPMPIMNARVENYAMDEQTQREEIGGIVRLQLDGTIRLQSNLQGDQQ